MKKNSTTIFRIGKLLLLTIPFLLGSCSKSFDKKIAEHIESKCSKFDDPYECMIDLHDITDFDWDSVYVFAGLTTVDDIYNAVGFTFKCKHVPDNYMRIIFVKGKQVVYQSQYYGLGSKVQFRPYTKEYVAFIHYSKNLSKFYVLKKNWKLVEGVCYDLYPVDGEWEPKYREEKKEEEMEVLSL
jgi:hypothetical protein